MKIALILNRLVPALTDKDHQVNLIRRKRHNRILVETIQSSGHMVRMIEDSPTLREEVNDYLPDLVFLQTFRADPDASILKIQKLLEELKIPYTGSPPETCQIAQNKFLAKEKFVQVQIPTPSYALVEKGDRNLIKPDHLNYPLFIKPLYGGCSMGIHPDNPANTDGEFNRILSETHTFSDLPVLVEEFIVGREFTAGILGNNPPTALPLIEFIDVGREGNLVPFRLFDAKTDTETHENIQCPAELKEFEKERIQQMAVAAYHSLGCRDYARVDIRCSEDGKPYVLEVNVHPSLLPTSSFPIMAARAGIGYPQLLGHIFQSALSRYRDFVF